jgi:uncharacterized integral membrane protein (TIGR00698 family)
VSFAVATITLFGVIAVVTYPIIGHLVGLTASQFGMWAGTAVNDTSQVVAAGYAFGTTSGDTAVIVKLTRNLAIAPVVVGAALAFTSNTGVRLGSRVRAAFPLFVLGFLFCALLRTAGLLDPLVAGSSLADWMAGAGQDLILIALAGVGLQTDLIQIRATGARPLSMGAVLAFCLATLSLVLITGLGLGR